MNKNKAIDILKKVYHHTNTDFNRTYYGEIGYRTEILRRTEQSVLNDAHLIPNNFEKLTHDSVIQGLLEIKNSGKLSLDFATSLFIKGLSGDYPRFRQTLISFWYMQGIEAHTFEKSESSSLCAVCGLPEITVEDRTHTLFTYYLGHSWNESPQQFLTELQEIMEYPKPEITEADIDRFKNLLLEIRKADENETPGHLEKRIAKSKILPKTDVFKRYGILQTLAVIGVLPSKPEFDTQPSRSDIVLPLAGWKGALGVNFEKVEDIFGIEV